MEPISSTAGHGLGSRIGESGNVLGYPTPNADELGRLRPKLFRAVQVVVSAGQLRWRSTREEAQVSYRSQERRKAGSTGESTNAPYKSHQGVRKGSRVPAPFGLIGFVSRGRG